MTSRTPRPVVVPTAYPDLTEARIRELGNIGMVIYGNHAVRAAVTARSAQESRRGSK
jgi:hypothetical protein